MNLEDFSPVEQAAHAAELAVNHGRFFGPLPASAGRIDNPVSCPARAKLTEETCRKLLDRAAEALARYDWTDSMAWFCGHCQRAPKLKWQFSGLIRMILTWMDHIDIPDIEDMERTCPSGF